LRIADCEAGREYFNVQIANQQRIVDRGARIANLGPGLGASAMSISIRNPQSVIRNLQSAILTIVFLLSVALARPQGEAGKAGAELEAIRRAFYQEDYSGAVSLAEQYLKKYPRSAKARIFLARAEMAQGKYGPA